MFGLGYISRVSANPLILPSGRRALKHTQKTSTFAKLLIVFFAALLAIFGSNTSGRLPAAEAAFSNKCDGAAANDQNNLRVTPNHGQVLYIDSGQGQQIDAAYATYSVQNLVATSRSNLWVKLDTFTGGAVSLANSNDAAFALGDVAASSSATSFFLLKALATSSSPQAHVVRVYQGKPGVAGSTELYSCTYTFSKVAETIKAAANKVTDITATSVTSVGTTMTVKVLGGTGTIGSGNVTDGSVLWFSPSGRSTWPTQSLRLESTSIQFYSNASRATNQKVGSPYLNKLRVTLSELQTAGSTTDKSFFYTADYTYRILGASATAATLVPVAQIASGTQMKHTDVASISSSTTTSIAVSAPTVSLAVNKSVSSTATVSGGVTTLSYTISLVNSGANPLTVDQVTDKPDPSLTYQTGSAKYNGVSTLDPGFNATTSELVFSGPFSVPANSTRTLTYKVDTSTCLSGSFSYSNSATATVGSTIIGSGATTMSITSASGSCGSTTVTAQSTTVALPIEVDTDIASVTGNTTATIYGLVDPNGDTGSTVFFDYGTSPTLAGATRTNVGTTAGQTAAYSVNKALTGLTSGTVYYYRVGAGTALGSILSFVTTEPVANPTATTTTATSMALVSSKINVTLNGTIDPNQVVNGAKITFQYAVDNSTGACTSLGTAVNVPTTGYLQDDTAADVVLSGAFPTEVNTGALVTGLTNGTRYCFKVRAWYNSASASWSTATDGAWVPFLAKVRLTQTLSYSTPADMTTGATQNTTASATSSLAVTYSSNSPEICSVSSSGVVTAIAAGTCSITATQPGNNDYDPADPVTVLFTVNPGPPVISTASLSSGVIGSAYSDSLSAIEGNGTYSNWRLSAGSLPPGTTLDSSTGSITGTPTTAGTYSVTFLVDSGAQTSASKTLSIIISKIAQSISVANISKTYGDATFTASATSSSGLSVTLQGDSTSVVTVNGSTFTIVGAGTATITASQSGDDSYSAAPSVTFTVTVAKAPLSVVGSSHQVVYGDVKPSVSPLITGWVLGESESDLSTVPSCSTGYSSSTSVSASPVAVSCSGGVAANYTFSYAAGSITIVKAALSVSAPSASLTYGDAKPSMVPSYSGFVNGQSASVLSTAPTCSTGYSSSTSVSASPVAVSCSGGVAANYTFSYAAGSITIAKAALTVAAPNIDLVYGDAAPTAVDLAPQITGFVNSQTANTAGVVADCVTDYQLGMPVAQSPREVLCLAELHANYRFDYVDADLTISKASLTITSKPVELIYGSAAPDYGYEITGWISGESDADLDVVGVCFSGYVATTQVGETPAIECASFESKNYQITYVDSSVNVLKAQDSITASPASLLGMRPAATQYLKLTTRSGFDPEITVSGGCAYDFENEVVIAPASIDVPIQECLLTVRGIDSRNFKAAETVTLTLQVSGDAKKTRSITSTLNKPVQTFEIDEKLTLSATIDPAVGNPEFKSQHPAVCTINSAGVITLLTVGTCELIAFTSETDEYAAAFAPAVVFEVAKITRIISMSAKPAIVFLPATSTLSYELSPNLGQVEYKVAGGASGCWVEQGQAMANNAGQCKLFAVALETDRFTRVTSSLFTVTFKEAVLIEPTQTPSPTPNKTAEPNPLPTPPVEEPQEPTEPTEPLAPWKASGKLPEPSDTVVPELGQVLVPNAPARTGESVDVVDFGFGPEPVDSESALLGRTASPIKQLSLDDLKTATFAGFAPGTGVRVDVAGVRTSGQFVNSGLGASELIGLRTAIVESSNRLATSFARITQAVEVAKPGVKEVLSGQVSDDAAYLFKASGLASPVLVGSKLKGDEKSWLRVSAEAKTYLPGSIVYLTVQSSPVIIGAAKVDEFGNAGVTGWLPMEILELGAHKVSLVGYRSISGVGVDEKSQITLPSSTLEDISKFDGGSQATVRVIGANKTGGVQSAIRVVYLDAPNPWLWLLLPLVAFAFGAIVALIRKRFSATNLKVCAVAAALLSVAPAWLAWIDTAWLVLAIAAIEFLVFVALLFFARRNR